MIEIETMCNLPKFMTLPKWAYGNDINTYRGIVQQLYAQMMGWA